MQQVDGTRQFIRRKFAAYYERNSIEAPPEVEKREFGAGVDSKIDYRHLTFEDERSLNAYVRTNAPLFISYWAAYYEFPDARPMEKKNWLGADLVFDLDAHDFEVSCEHAADWSCERCLGVVKGEVQKIIDDFLMPDFGISRNEIVVIFSGNQGYHLHIRGKAVRELNQQARKEIVDYFTASNLSLRDVGFRKDGKIQRGPMASDYGWGGRLASRVRGLMESAESGKELAEALGTNIKTAEKIINNKSEILRGIDSGNWDVVRLPKDAWEGVLQSVAMREAVQIDRNVTLDVSRLMRLPNSLHGGTGFKACTVRQNDMGDFNPFSDALVFGETPMKIRAKSSVKFSLNEQTFALKEGEVMELPEFAAMYALCRGVANAIVIL